jgi:hypothetical protein
MKPNLRRPNIYSVPQDRPRSFLISKKFFRKLYKITFDGENIRVFENTIESEDFDINPTNITVTDCYGMIACVENNYGSYSKPTGMVVSKQLCKLLANQKDWKKGFDIQLDMGECYNNYNGYIFYPTTKHVMYRDKRLQELAGMSQDEAYAMIDMLQSNPKKIKSFCNKVNKFFEKYGDTRNE